jgi:hypothetical protein
MLIKYKLRILNISTWQYIFSIDFLEGSLENENKTLNEWKNPR